ncbi:TetR/AcrR family transcriptional regulator [Sediminivirga luteola]|uniref:TetR family transcriptional regulator n=1 Tax=Sediminivirga luteola TaxID=1774748 RepID=A0A8J2XK79_9MICO|nr:TetR/AcrR family transcriptional regulator [Sediminivirga luteola]MCI2265670.1 TetR/AcrR family transcriptional regulator [Sediminivirga luteola]GGA07509.1 TetR family transcriptional regulator [Sediminivirga luteola]
MAPSTARPARARLLEAASRLFYAHGMNATGIDAVVAEADVAKKSLYNNFSSKEELMLAYIEARHEEWLQLYREREELASSATARVLAVFDAYIDHASQAYEHGFRGCGLLNAAAELPAGAAGRTAVRQHKEQVEAILAEHLRSLTAEADEGERVAVATAEHLSFLLEGAISRAGLEGGPDRLRHARALAASLLETLAAR